MLKVFVGEGESKLGSYFKIIHYFLGLLKVWKDFFSQFFFSFFFLFKIIFDLKQMKQNKNVLKIDITDKPVVEFVKRVAKYGSENSACIM